MSSDRAKGHPLDFRRDEVRYVTDRWRAGDCCALVGVGSVGKSNLLIHLGNYDVHKAYLQIANEHDFKAVIINPNMLGPLPPITPETEQFRCWAGYELIMHRLVMAFYPFEQFDRADAERFYALYNTLQDGSNPLYSYMGLRYLEQGLNILFRYNVRIVLMFDEFEDMLKHLPTKFFQTLRGLRDANKRQLSYLTFTRAPLAHLVDMYHLPQLEMEPFIELFTDSILYVGPYNEIDARRMLDNLMSRNNKHYPEATIRFLTWATGNYAGLLRSGFRLLDSFNITDMRDSQNEEWLRQLASRRSIRDECAMLWASLTDIERHTMKMVAQIIPYHPSADTEQAIAMLVQKRLLRVERPQNVLYIEPPVFRMFIATNADTLK